MAKKKKKKIKIKISAKMRKIIMGCPKYDPFLDATDDMWFDEEAAQLALDFYPKFLIHVKGPLTGQPLEIEPWWQAVIANIFGWKTGDGYRRFKEVLVYVPRKNSKSTYIAGLVNLLHFINEDRFHGSEIYMCAAEKKQASIIFDIAKQQAEHDPELLSRGIFQRYIVMSKDRSCSYQALSADGDKKMGFNPSAIMVDELHVMPLPKPGKTDLIDTLETGQVGRPNSLLVHATTADHARESVCNEKLKYAKEVRDDPEVIDSAFLPCIWETEIVPGEEIDWTDIELYKACNPMWGKGVIPEKIERYILKAKRIPRHVNELMRLHLNIVTKAKCRWLNMEYWNNIAEGIEPIEWRQAAIERWRNSEASVGLDLGGSSDLTALALLFRDEDGFEIIPYFWIPKEGKILQDADYKGRFQKWIDEGFIIEVAGRILDTRHVRKEINLLAGHFAIPEIYVDRLFQGVQLCTELAEDGFEITSFGQGFLSYAGPCRDFEDIIIEEKLQHGNNPVLSFCAENIEVITDPAGNIKPCKPPNESMLKIDGMTALIMAYARASLTSVNAGASAYDDAELFFG